MFRTMLMGAAWLLPLVVLLLFLVKGRYYDADVYRPPVMESAALPMPVNVAGWNLESPEYLPADRMYEKINGKAGYYLQYGAEGLYSGEWVLNDQRWDMYLYHFTTHHGALGAFNGERPVDGVPIEGIEGYAVPGQVSISTGRYYLQLNAFAAKADSGPAIELALALAPHLKGAARDSDQESGIDLVALAGVNLAGEAEGLIPENAFGFSVLDNVRTVEVSLGGVAAVWFMTEGDEGTISAFAEELSMYGGENMFREGNASGGSMFDSWVIAGVLDGAVWGVQNASSRETLMLHWNALQDRLNNGVLSP